MSLTDVAGVITDAPESPVLDGLRGAGAQLIMVR
jgi:hypothetical protein